MREEKAWALKFALFVIVITTLPYFLGYQLQGENWRFTGFWFGVEDGNSYIAKMLASSWGGWLLKSPYTTYQQNGLFILMPYVLLGKLVSPPAEHEQLVALFHLFRWLSVAMVVLATYDFLSIFLRNIFYRRLGAIVITLGGGLGWLSVVGMGHLWGGALPLDFYSPETFGFLAVFGIPHMVMGRAFFLWSLGIYFRMRQDRVTPRDCLMSGVLLLFAGLMQPIFVMIGWAVIVIDVVVRILIDVFDMARKSKLSAGGVSVGSVLWLILIFLFSLPIVAYLVYISFTDGYFKIWQIQNVLPSPPISHYLLAYGWVLPLVLIGLYGMYRKHIRAYGMMGWLFLFPLLVYLPLGFQRRMAEGFWVLLTVLGLYGLEVYRIPKKVSWVYGASLVSFLVLLAGSLLGFQSRCEPSYLPADKVKAFRQLSAIISPGEVVLASYNTSNALPAWVPAKVIVGHGVESADLSTALRLVNRMYQPTTDDSERYAVIKQFNVRYIFWGPDERAIGIWHPSSLRGTELVYQQAGYEIYRIAALTER